MPECFICQLESTKSYRPYKDQDSFNLCDRCYYFAKERINGQKPTVDRIFWIRELEKSWRPKGKEGAFHCAITNIKLQTEYDDKPNYLSVDHCNPHSSNSRTIHKGKQEITIFKARPVAQLFNDMKSDHDDDTFIEFLKTIVESHEGKQNAIENLHERILSEKFNFKRGSFKGTHYCKPCKFRWKVELGKNCKKCGNDPYAKKS